MGIIELSTRRPVAITMLTVAVLLFGWVSLQRLEVTLLPNLSYPTLTVRTELPGAAPTEIETLLSKPIEEAVGVIKNVRQVRSSSQAGRSDVTLEFNWGTEMDMAVLDLREKLDALILPKEAVRPIVLRFDPSQDPIVRLGMSLKSPEQIAHDRAKAEARKAGKAEPAEPAAAAAAIQPTASEADLKRLRRVAEEQVQKMLEGVPGIAAVKISGGLEDEVQVLVDLSRLSQLGLTLEQIGERLRAENANISGGRVDEGTVSYLVRTLNQFKSLGEIADTIVATRENRPVYVKDIAEVRAGFKEREAIIRIDGAEAVEIALYKEGDANAVAVAEGALHRTDTIRKALAEDLQITTLYDQSVFIKQAISDVMWAAIEGGVLAILVLYLFLHNGWITFVISLAIPVSVIATFNVMLAWGASLNIMSLGGIALAIGLLVDDAIVVLENITRKHEQGLPLVEATVVGSQEVVAAVTASTLTTVAVFFPMVFVQGIAGQLFADQALVVTGSLLFSLVVSFTLTPMLVAWQGRRRSVPEGRVPALLANRPASTFPARPGWPGARPLVVRGIGESPVAWWSRWALTRIAGFFRDLLQWLVAFGGWLVVDVPRWFASGSVSAARAAPGWARSVPGRIVAFLKDVAMWLPNFARELVHRRWRGAARALFEPAISAIVWIAHRLWVGAYFVFELVVPAILRVVLVFVGVFAWVATKVMQPLARTWQRGYKGFENRYVPVLAWSLQHRNMVLGAAGGMFVLSMLLLTRIGVELLPPFNQGEFRTEVTLAPGTPLERTDAVLQGVSAKVRGDQALAANYSVAGTGNRLDTSADTGGENFGVLNLALQSGAYDQEGALMDKLRAQLDGLPGVSYRFTRPTLFTLKTPLEVEVAGYELDAMQRVSEQLRARMLASDRFTEVETSLKPGHPELQIVFDQERAAALKLNTAELAARVARAVQGTVATRYRLEDREIDVLVRGREADRQSIAAVQGLVINPDAERPLTLSAVAEVTLRTGPSEIRRLDQERVVLLSANLVYGDLGDAVVELQRMIGEVAMPPGVAATVAGQSEEMEVSFRSLQLALALAIFLVYLVMASEFESLIHPFVILFTIPLALIGAVLALYVTGSVINVIALIGMIMLAGIVVKNGIVLIDLVNRLREEGMDRTRALIEGGRSRLRPILMTTLTAILGLLPMAIGTGEGAEVRAPMAITVIGGLMVSTLLTLVVIPVVYTLLDRHEYAADRATGGLAPASQK
ncbi:MAG: efflux RND transporter permease subunit [Gammaproteobacteria bacterium]